MTSPVSQSNSSYYDPNAQVCRAEDSTRSSSVSEPSPQVSPPRAREVTLPPVSITGDAGTRQLVDQYERTRRVPDCSTDGKNALLSCGKAALMAIGTGVASPTGIVAVVGVGKTLLDSISCGKDLRAYYDCKVQ